MMKVSVCTIVFALMGVFSALTLAQQPAARFSDATSGGGAIVSGASTVFINGLPAARRGDSATTPRSEGQIPCVGGPIVTGSVSVLIEGFPAARVGDQISLSPCAPEFISTGSPNVLID